MEKEILLWIQESLRRTSLDKLFSLVSYTGDGGKIYVITLLTMCCFKSTRRSALMIAILIAAYSLIFTLGVKHIVNRTRPFEAAEGLTTIGSLPSDSSFPSGHTGTAFTFAIGLFYLCNPILGIIAIAYACLMGFSRMYLEVHYPSDVLAGALFGTLTAIIGIKLFMI